jgi:hypothetical protein
MTPKQTMDFVRCHGLILESARGSEPSLTAKVAGQPIKGNWWGHPKGHEIYDLTQKIHDSKAVLVCTLARGRITYIHRRLWPFFVCLSDRFPTNSLDEVQEIHLPTGQHKRQDTPFPQWVPTGITTMACALNPAEAEAKIAIWLHRYGK